ncbi:MAG TPA: M24 family metallopeptidase [Candidatus Limnocylindrales bacterium]|nr:M24 family metallopeptidase [Candidatus Limnocylindrales bacterium]
MTAATGATGWPSPDDFAPPPSAADRERWREADRAARPARIARVRARFAAAGVDAFFGLRPETSRYLSGFALGDCEDRVAGNSGQLLVSADEVVLFADSRYDVQAHREAPDARVATVYGDLPARWPDLCGSIGARRVAVEAAAIPKAVWDRLEAAGRPAGIELVPVEGWLEADRATKEPAEIERVAASCAIADGALAALLPEIRPGCTERELALRLEWLMRTRGADALAFDVACLFGPEAALPHGSPGDRPIAPGSVLLFDFGAQVDGYRSDMTRTLFVGEPSAIDLSLYELVARAQAAAMAAVSTAVEGNARPLPSGRAIDAVARQVVEASGYGPRFGHGTGHGIGLATHEEPRLSRTATEDVPLPSPTVFSIEPGVYLEGETGVRIEDLVAIDAEAHAARVLTRFPREILVVGV